MPIDRADFENLTEDDLVDLMNAQVPEGLRVEYKRELYGSTDADKREALKDVSAFANAHGGHLIIGITEQGGIPVSIDGIATIDPDEVVLRLEQLIRGGIEPRVTGVRTQAIRLVSGNFCFVVKVPRSWNPPHRVSAQNSNRFFVRNSGGVHEASMDELRELFTLGATAIERAQTFRQARVDAIIRGASARPLQSGGRLILHIAPLSAFASSLRLDLELVFQYHTQFPPIGAMGMSPRFNFEGFINERGGEMNLGYTQVFRSGILEATQAGIIRELDGYRLISGPATEQRLFRVLSMYINGLDRVGIPAPLLVMLTLEGVAGVLYAVTGDVLLDPPTPIDRPILFLPECVVNEYGSDIDYHRAIRPAFDALWNAAGRARADSFNQEGRWIG